MTRPGTAWAPPRTSTWWPAGGAWTSTSPSAATVSWLWGTSDTGVYASAGSTTYGWNGATWTALPLIPTNDYGSSPQASQMVNYYQCTVTRACYSSYRWDGTACTQGATLSKYSVPTGQWVPQDGSVVAILSRFSKVVIATPAAPPRAVRRAGAVRAPRTR